MQPPLPRCLGTFAVVTCLALSLVSFFSAEAGPDSPLQFLETTASYDKLAADASELLRLFERGEDCHQFLRSLPLHCLHADLTLSTVAEQYQAQVSDLCLDNVNSHAALEVVPSIADTAVYPLVVLLEATARATAIPLVFWLDLIQGFSNALLNKKAFVQLTERYQTKNRYWMVGTANVAEGKSPAMTPVAMAAERALQRHSAMAVGSAGDQFHLQQAGRKIQTKYKYFFVFLFPFHIAILFCLSFQDIHCRAVPALQRVTNFVSVKATWLFIRMRLALACALPLPMGVPLTLPNSLTCNFI